ncbi:hypothetical protein [Citrobacter freundii]|uniref:hypothetical protein n=1 Tax=Citrobacter freundii TaxID=546 RepID=UPI00388ECB69
MDRLVININAKSFDDQKKETIQIIKNHFQCEDYEAEHYLYSNAFRKIYDISCNKKDRRIKNLILLKVSTNQKSYLTYGFINMKEEKNI